MKRIIAFVDVDLQTLEYVVKTVEVSELKEIKRFSNLKQFYDWTENDISWNKYHPKDGVYYDIAQTDMFSDMFMDYLIESL